MHPNTEEVRRPAWMNIELLDKLKHKMESYRGWKQGEAALKEHPEVVQAVRDQIMTATALIESDVLRHQGQQEKLQ